jgi:hypothetical protein
MPRRFREGDQAALLIAIDTLIAGPDLTAAADALAVSFQ